MYIFYTSGFWVVQNINERNTVAIIQLEFVKWKKINDYVKTRRTPFSYLDAIRISYMTRADCVHIIHVTLIRIYM